MWLGLKLTSSSIWPKRQRARCSAAATRWNGDDPVRRDQHLIAAVDKDYTTGRVGGQDRTAR
jgi:hypothetical protein